MTVTLWTLDILSPYLVVVHTFHSITPVADTQEATDTNDVTGNALKTRAALVSIKGAVSFSLPLLLNGNKMDINLYDIMFVAKFCKIGKKMLVECSI